MQTQYFCNVDYSLKMDILFSFGYFCLCNNFHLMTKPSKIINILNKLTP